MYLTGYGELIALEDFKVFGDGAFGDLRFVTEGGQVITIPSATPELLIARHGWWQAPGARSDIYSKTGELLATFEPDITEAPRFAHSVVRHLGEERMYRLLYGLSQGARPTVGGAFVRLDLYSITFANGEAPFKDPPLTMFAERKGEHTDRCTRAP